MPLEVWLRGFGESGGRCLCGNKKSPAVKQGPLEHFRSNFLGKGWGRAKTSGFQQPAGRLVPGATGADTFAAAYQNDRSALIPEGVYFGVAERRILRGSLRDGKADVLDMSRPGADASFYKRRGLDLPWKRATIAVICQCGNNLDHAGMQGNAG